MSEDWFYQDEAAEHGPLSAAELMRRARDGRLGAEMRVRMGSDGDWALAGEVAPFAFAALDAEIDPPPPPAGWADATPHPGRRFAARAFDYVVVGGALWAIGLWALHWISPGLAASAPAFDGLAGSSLRAMLILAALVPLQALCLGLTGFTPGKWVFGVRLRPAQGTLTTGLAFRREFWVWWRGLGAGAPLISLVLGVECLRRLEREGVTPWDEALSTSATYREEGLISEALMALAAAALAALWFMTEIVGRSFWGS